MKQYFLVILSLSLLSCNVTSQLSGLDLPEIDAPGIDVASRLRGAKITQILAKDAIPSIDNPTFVTASVAEEWMEDNELIIGIVDNAGKSRAYSTWLLDRHEIVNDTFNGKPAAITWCPLVALGVAFERQLDDGQVLEFGVSGALFKDALVMYDRQTDSLWTQVTGEVLKGKLLGSKLKTLPSVQTSWKNWKKLHPDTQVLSKVNAQGQIVGTQRVASYIRYNQTDDQGVFGFETGDKRLKPKDLILGISFPNSTAAKAFPLSSDEKVFNDKVGDIPVLVVNSNAETALAYERTLDEQTLIFETTGQKNIFKDAETKSQWVLQTDQNLTAADGAFKGKSLKLIHSSTIFWFAWTSFFPDTELVS